ncbi:ATP-dependent zinc protease [Vibrio tapetis subsp. quintayensis]|uniref:ATP-dependent zinc protease family protein n=1 Tax=Vibrio tapetis TaxID=52443 RepID=UPI0025B41851|nr:ATP-dependent zinc protease [Vibrio tapetis]MDN3682386.1 ATP-dependent zinc protease [Vibrio tapetis subsp. quintayensis]
MLKKLTAIAIIAALSGCTLIDGEKYSQSTLEAINQSEQNIQTKLDSFTVEIDQQNSKIDALNEELVKLNGEVVQLRKTQAKHLTHATKETQTVTPVVTSAPPSQPIVLGAIEKVKVDTIKQQFDARVDTGATTSSINAIDIQEFERNGKTWVKFHIKDDSAAADEMHWIEAPVVRYVKIRQATNSDSERRIVVELWVQLGDVHEKAQFTLADRSQMSHPILLGREFIQDIALVDVSKQYLQTKTK